MAVEQKMVMAADVRYRMYLQSNMEHTSVLSVRESLLKELGTVAIMI